MSRIPLKMQQDRAVQQLIDIHSAILTQLSLPRYQGIQLLTNALKRFHQLCKNLLQQRTPSETLVSGVCLWLQKYLGYCAQYDFKYTLFFEFADAARALRNQIDGFVDAFYVGLLGVAENAAAVQNYIRRASDRSIPPNAALSARGNDQPEAVRTPYSILQKQVEDLDAKLQAQQNEADAQYKSLQKANFSLVEQLREQQQKNEQLEHEIERLKGELEKQGEAHQNREQFCQTKLKQAMLLLGELTQQDEQSQPENQNQNESASD